MDMELEWTMGAQRLAQHGAHCRTHFYDTVDSCKVGLFSDGDFLGSGGSGRGSYPPEPISTRPALGS